MPLTVKLSRRFYERLGDDVANELVDVLNAVDQGYRTEFRDLFDVRFAQFEARLESMQQTMRAEMRAMVAQSERTIIRWMFGFWIGQLAVTVGLLIALRQLLT